MLVEEVYDLYFSKQAIVDNLLCIMLYALSWLYLKVLPLLKLTVMTVFLPISDLRITKRFEVKELFEVEICLEFDIV